MMNLRHSLLPPATAILGWLAATAVPAVAAPPVANTVQGSDEIRVPTEYVRMKLNRYTEKVPPAEYRVVVDITPGKQGQATVTRSSGVKSVDAVALDFADAYSTQVERLRELRKTREMRFPLVFDLKQDAGTWNTNVPDDAVEVKTSLHGRGTYILRAVTGPNGRVIRTSVVKSSGLDRFDEALADYAKRHWFGPPNSVTLVKGTAGTRF